MSTEYRKVIEDDGTVIESYFENGKLHRDDAPAVRERKADGSITEKYYRHGELFRPDIPAPVVVERNASEDETTEHYARAGKVFRTVTQFGPHSPLNSRNGQTPGAPNP